MNVLKCTMCGGMLDIKPGENVLKCPYCGTLHTMDSFDDEQRAIICLQRFHEQLEANNRELAKIAIDDAIKIVEKVPDAIKLEIYSEAAEFFQNTFYANKALVIDPNNTSLLLLKGKLSLRYCKNCVSNKSNTPSMITKEIEETSNLLYNLRNQAASSGDTVFYGDIMYLLAEMYLDCKDDRETAVKCAEEAQRSGNAAAENIINRIKHIDQHLIERREFLLSEIEKTKLDLQSDKKNAQEVENRRDQLKPPKAVNDAEPVGTAIIAVILSVIIGGITQKAGILSFEAKHSSQIVSTSISIAVLYVSCFILIWIIRKWRYSQYKARARVHADTMGDLYSKGRHSIMGVQTKNDKINTLQKELDEINERIQEKSRVSS